MQNADVDTLVLPVSAGGLEDEQGKHAILFAATILATRKLNETGSTPWAIHIAITDAIDKANLILEKIDERWPVNDSNKAAVN